MFNEENHSLIDDDDYIDLTLSPRSMSPLVMINPTTFSSVMLEWVKANRANPLSIFSKEDARYIFAKKNVLFVGDTTIQTHFRDLVNLLETGEELKDEEIDIEETNYSSPTNLRSNDLNWKRKYFPDIDAQAYHLPSPIDTTIFYIRIHSILSSEMTQVFNWLESDRPQLNAIIFYSLENDMNRLKMMMPFLTFHEHFFNYTIGLDYILERLSTIIRQISNSCRVFWFTSYWSRWCSQMRGKEYQWKMVNDRCQFFVGKHGCQYFDRGILLEHAYPPFNIRETGRFSSKGIRLISTIVSEILMDTWKKPILVLV